MHTSMPTLASTHANRHHAYTCKHSCTPACPHLQALMHTSMPTLASTHAHQHAHTCMHSCTPACPHLQALMHTSIPTHASTHAHQHPHTCKHTCTQACPRMRASTPACPHTQAHVHTGAMPTHACKHTPCCMLGTPSRPPVHCPWGGRSDGSRGYSSCRPAAGPAAGWSHSVATEGERARNAI